MRTNKEHNIIKGNKENINKQGIRFFIFGQRDNGQLIFSLSFSFTFFFLYCGI